METWVEDEYRGIRAWVGRTPELEVTILPDLGCKMISLRTRGRQWLWQTKRNLGGEGYGTPYEKSDGSGWDEMFPTIDACLYPDGPWKGIEAPDHGEVWSIPWSAYAKDGKLCCEVRGIRFPYLLKKTYSFQDGRVLLIDYEVKNLSIHTFPYLWAAHPLMDVPPGTRIELGSDSSVKRSFVVRHSRHGRIGETESVQTWPTAHVVGKSVSLNTVPESVAWISPEDQQMSAGIVTDIADKLYFEEWAPGTASLVLPGSGERLTFRANTMDVPYLAIWLNYGGYRGEQNIALEPVTGWMDSVERAVRVGKCTTLEPLGQRRWRLEVMWQAGAVDSI